MKTNSKTPSPKPRRCTERCLAFVNKKTGKLVYVRKAGMGFLLEEAFLSNGKNTVVPATLTYTI